MQLKQKFAIELRNARGQHKLTQEELAGLVSISTRSIQYIEKGVWLPKPETMLRLMIVLHIPADLFAEEVGLSDFISSDEREPVHA